MLADPGYPARMDGRPQTMSNDITTRASMAPFVRRWVIAVAVGASIMAVGLVVSALARSPLTWDGAWFFVRTADTGTPTFLVRRAIHAVLQSPAILITRIDGDVDRASLAFSVPYAAMPLIGWLAAWWVVRRDRPAAMLWPTLGICLVTLPGQMNFLTEAGIAANLAWALVLASALGSLVRHKLLVATFVVLLAICHPFAGPSLVIVGLISLLAGAIRSRAARDGVSPVAPGTAGGSTRPDGPPVGLCLVLIGIGLSLAAYLLRIPYEVEASSLPELAAKFRASIADPSVIAPIAAWTIGVLAFVRLPARARFAVIVAILAATLMVLVSWADDPRAWSSGLRFRAWPVILSFPVWGLAVIDLLRRSPTWDRRVVLVGAPLVFSIVLGVQAVSWIGLRERLSDTLAAATVACVEGPALDWISGTALDHWSITSLAVVGLGHEPRHLALIDRSCTDALTPDRTSVVIKETPFDRDDRPVDGWWGFRRLAEAWPGLAPP